ncbi:ThiF family adenylyltransferase [Shewanella xiamenensis]|uniref:HesA/MoeB/ThiF family protein n=1 Tax=Shewanella xiamenensis TaxID=332186 RepID=UPI00313BA892
MNAPLAALDKIYRMRASVALVTIESTLEMFRTNVREQLLIQISYEDIIPLLMSFNGIKSVREIHCDYELCDIDEFLSLIIFLNEQRILIEVDICYMRDFFSENYRMINLLEDYSGSTSSVINKIKNINDSTVMIVGLGAVGTWVADSLSRTGVENFILVDDDVVEESNLHRQTMYFEEDIGKFKVDCVERELINNGAASIKILKEKIDDFFFTRNKLDFDLVINCADYPSVDYTTEIIAQECMPRRKPHIIGGGYNLHLTLIGQTVIPNKTACVKCFQLHLEKINNADLKGVRKLNRKHRKIGSYGPICTLSSSITATEALKVLSGSYENVINSNKRIEFIINELDFKIINIEKNDMCEWCGSEGKYSRI